MPVKSFLIAVVLTVCSAGSAFAGGLEEAAPVPAAVAGVSAKGQAFRAAARLGRGINFGNILDASPGEGDWGLRLSDQLFDLAAEAGFDTVRLPVRWTNHAEVVAPFRIHKPFAGRVDYAIDAALSRGLNIVVDLRHHRQLCGEPLDEGEPKVPAELVEPRFLAIWAQIAERYRGLAEDRLLFELYNEPNSGCSAERWNDLLKRALDVVRQSNPSRPVVIGPASWNNAEALADLVVPEDPALIITIHNDAPFQFTHQGAQWVGPESAAWLGTGCCSQAQRAEIVRPLEIALTWSAGRWPLWVGEFGAYGKAPDADRLRYTRFAREAMESRGIPWAYWELASGFGIWDPDSGRWREELRDALLPPALGARLDGFSPRSVLAQTRCQASPWRRAA